MPTEIPSMDTHRNWWNGSGHNALQCFVESDEDCPQPIPFPSRRARMSLRPPHALDVTDVTIENRTSSMNAGAALEAVSLVNRKMNDLARELDCLWFYDDENDDQSTEPPSAA